LIRFCYRQATIAGQWLDAEPLDAGLPRHTIEAAARLRHWVCENAKSLRAFLKRVDAVAPLGVPIAELRIQELPRAAHKHGDHAPGQALSDADCAQLLAPLRARRARPRRRRRPPPRHQRLTPGPCRQRPQWPKLRLRRLSTRQTRRKKAKFAQIAATHPTHRPNPNRHRNPISQRSLARNRRPNLRPQTPPLRRRSPRHHSPTDSKRKHRRLAKSLEQPHHRRPMDTARQVAEHVFDRVVTAINCYI
jgi:hypothetical protein